MYNFTVMNPRHDINLKNLYAGNMIGKRVTLLALIAIFLYACQSIQGYGNFAATQIPESTPTITPTIVWFPSTATLTPIATVFIPPTPDAHPGIGDILFVDNFEEPDKWTTGEIADGTVAVENNQLSIAISQERTYRSSFRDENIPINAYIEITANPNMCVGADAYGILVRTSARRYYFRFLLSCDGQVRLERVKNDSITVLQPWTPSGAVPIGAPSVSKISVWLAESELRFFVNDLFQFAAQDAAPINGGFGVFAYEADKSAVTVSFKNLVVMELTPPIPSTTPTLSPDIPLQTQTP